jgi:single-strand DNA-binding protein
MLNRVILMGRLTADPELKTTPSGVSVTNFNIAVERSYVKNGEERKADFFSIVCWRNTAEFVCRYFSKGSLVALEGQLQSRTYQAQDGSNRTVVEVVADNVSFTGERRENSGNSQPAPQPTSQAEPIVSTPAFSNPEYSNNGFTQMPLDDDLPF